MYECYVRGRDFFGIHHLEKTAVASCQLIIMTHIIKEEVLAIDLLVHSYHL